MDVRTIGGGTSHPFRRHTAPRVPARHVALSRPRVARVPRGDPRATLCTFRDRPRARRGVLDALVHRVRAHLARREHLLATRPARDARRHRARARRGRRRGFQGSSARLRTLAATLGARTATTRATRLTASSSRKSTRRLRVLSSARARRSAHRKQTGDTRGSVTRIT